MNDENTAPSTRADDGYGWLRDGSVPHTREDLVAEALALIALIFSVGIGLVIALLPVPAKAVTPEVRAAHVAAQPGLGPVAREGASNGR
jgi:hypothetical protein